MTALELHLTEAIRHLLQPVAMPNRYLNDPGVPVMTHPCLTPIRAMSEHGSAPHLGHVSFGFCPCMC